MNDHPCLALGCTILTAYAEKCRGPGWQNSPLWVIYRDDARNLQLDCIQPEEQTAEMMALYETANSLNKELVNAVERWMMQHRPAAKSTT